MKVPRRVAAMTPAGMPSTTAKIMAQSGELQRRREQRQELVQHRRVRRDRRAEIAVGDLPEIVEELLPDRLVEAELVAKLGQPLGRDAAFAGAHLDRIARHEADRDEGQEGDREKGRDDAAAFAGR